MYEIRYRNKITGEVDSAFGNRLLVEEMLNDPCVTVWWIQYTD